MKETKRARSKFSVGEAIQLKTTFDGCEAPGGMYYPLTRHYVKVCKSPKAGRHPHKAAFGGIDSEIFAELTRSGCQSLELRLPGVPAKYAAFEDLSKEGFSVSWKDPRFTGPRRYLDEKFWHNSPLGLKNRLLYLSLEARRRQEDSRQLSFFPC